MSQQIENTQEPENKEKLSNVTALNRFIRLRSIDPVFNNDMRWKLSKDYDHEIKQIITEMITIDPLSPSNALCKSAHSAQSTNEALWCLAYCLRESQNESACVELRKNFLQLVPTSDDLLFFLKNYDKTAFSAGMRNCLTKWYDSKTPSELLEMIFALGKHDKLKHRDIITRLHPKFENADKTEITAAAFKTYNQIKEGAKTSSTLTKILLYKDLKRCTDVAGVVAILKRKEFNFKLHHLPTCVLKSPEVIELILPNLSLAEVVAELPNFCDRKLLKDTTSKKVINALQGSAKAVNEAKLNPVRVLEIIKKLSGPEIIVKKEEGAAVESDKKEKKVMHPQIVQKLRVIFNQSLGEQQKSGCRFFVTVDLRKFSKRQSTVTGMKNTSCAEVQAILALMLLKNEKDVTIMSFSDDKNKLKSVPWTRDTSFEKAMEIYEKENMKTKENIALPLKKAAEDKKEVDVFITFVSSVARTMGTSSKPPVDALENYQKAMKLNKAKLVVINLTRKKSDFKFDVNSKGILEVVGFGPDTIKVVDAFAKNCFN